MTFLQIGGKQLSFLFQSRVRIQRNLDLDVISTVDHLVRFERFFRVAFIHDQHLVWVRYFYLEKAYNTTDYEGPSWLHPKRTSS